jgi:hypothetical protein
MRGQDFLKLQSIKQTKVISLASLVSEIFIGSLSILYVLQVQ